MQTEEQLVACSLRGRFKKERFSLLVGDEVVFSLLAEDKGVIEEILPRRSLLSRPLIANVDQVIINFAAANPDLNPVLLDRFLVIAEMSALQVIICINKIDLADKEQLPAVLDLYRHIGYQVLTISVKNGTGLTQLEELLQDKITVFAGPSGTGKSSILNALEPNFALATGQVSTKIGRGKHTTRFAQLLPLSGSGYVVDTPGFSLTEFEDLEARELVFYFRDMVTYAGKCHFASCLHHKEPRCAVKTAVAAGKIQQERYNSYLSILSELQESKKGSRL